MSNTEQIDDSEGVIVQNKLILISGDPGSGKSFFATLIASAYREIHSNLRIYYNGEQVSNDLYSISEIKKLSFSKTKGVIIIDEAGVNMNSRKFMTDENLEYGKLAMLGRKLNKDIIVIAQMDHTVDKNVRMLCKHIFNMRSWPVSKEKLMFEFTLKNRDDSIQAIKEIDLFEWSRLSGYSYSSLESSAITKEEEKEEKRKIKKKDPIQEYDEYWKDDEVDEWIKSSEEASYEFEQEKIKRNKRAAKM